jgi:hypothetical protein
MHPKPNIRPSLPNQAPRGIVRPDQGKEDQEPDNMAWNGRQNGVGKVGCRTKHDTHKKVEKKLGPKEALYWTMRKRKQGG